MNDLIAQVLDEIKGAIRFRWLAVAVAWAVCLLGWLAVLSLPDKYQATARVFVDTRTALTPILQGLAIQQDVAAQVNYMQQSLLGKAQLEKVALQTGMYTEKTSTREKNEVLAGLREGVKVNAGGSANGGAVFAIRYETDQRERGLEVVKILLDAFVNDTLGGKQNDSAAAQQFLAEQIRDNENRLSESEQRLAEFKKKNVGVMPGDNGDYFSGLQKEIQTNKAVEASLAIANKRREELVRQLRGEVPVTMVASTARNDKSSGPAMDTAARISEAETRLAQLQLMYTDKHPDVVALQDSIAKLKERQATEVAALRRGDPGAAAAIGASANPIYQSIQLALNQTDVDIAALRGEYADRQARIAELRKLVDTVPEVEAEYARLNRDYGVTKAQYGALVDRLERAKLGDQAEASGSVRFEVIDPPNAAFEPISPNRKLLLFGVLVVALGAGGGAAYLMHFFKPVFSSTRAVHEVTGLPVLGVVSMTWSEQRRGMLNRSYYACVASVVVLLFAFVGVFKFRLLGARLLQDLIS